MKDEIEILESIPTKIRYRNIVWIPEPQSTKEININFVKQPEENNQGIKHKSVSVVPISDVVSTIKRGKGRPRSWTDEQELFVTENYYKISTKEIAEKLGRTKKAIEARAYILGVTKNNLGGTIKKQGGDYSKTSKKPLVKAPDNTTLFWHWIKNKKEFDIRDFVKENAIITKEHADKIVIYQLDKHRVQQTGATTFLVHQD